MTDGGPDADQRAVLASLLRFVFGVVLIGMVAIGVALMAPAVVEEFDRLDDIDGWTSPSPSSEPPPAGERNPNVTDPGDPGNSSYETDVETIESWTVEDFVHDEVNERRADHGLEPLDWDGTVASVARAHSYDMAQREYFDHVNPDGEEPFDRFRDVDDYCRGFGENIARTSVDRPVTDPNTGETTTHETAEGLANGLVNQWMNSTPHRNAILEEGETADADWDRGGVGVYITDDGEVFASHNFCNEW